MNASLSDTAPVAVASHPRSGTHLLIDLLRRQFADCASWKYPVERNDRLYCNIDELQGESGILTDRTARRILSRVQRPLIKTHAWPGLDEGFLPSHRGLQESAWRTWIEERARFLYIWRDVRAVMCSYYLFCMGAGLIASSLSVGDFMRQPHGKHPSRVQAWAEHVRRWSAKDEVEVLNFSQLLSEPHAHLRRMEQVLELEPHFREPLLPDPFQSIWESRRARFFGIRPESTAIINGKKLDWQQALTGRDLQFIEREVSGAPDWAVAELS